MAKKGRTRHLKRIAIPKSIPLTTKKRSTWLIMPNPGPHTADLSMPLAVFLRDILQIAKSSREVKSILNNRLVKVDGKIRTEPKFPVGFMDAISLEKSDKYYTLSIDHKGRLAVQEITKQEANKKIVKVIKKHTIKKGKINLTFHDGRNMIADNNVRVGDSVLLSLPEAKLKSLIKLEVGSKCLITEGKHSGTIATLKEIIQRKEGKENEAKLQSKDGEFTTVAKYLFAVDDSFKPLHHNVKGAV